jgi:uncharacterized membrane protein
MFSFYLVLKFIHILSAVTAVGANITYGVWNVRAQRDPSHTAFALKGIKFLDDRIANPAYGVVLVTGLLMIFVGNWSITSLWIVIALLLFAAIVVLGLFFYTPQLRDQIKLVEAGDTSSPDYERVSRRNQMVGPALGVIVILILVIMVFKPHL